MFSSIQKPNNSHNFNFVSNSCYTELLRIAPHDDKFSLHIVRNSVSLHSWLARMAVLFRDSLRGVVPKESGVAKLRTKSRQLHICGLGLN